MNIRRNAWLTPQGRPLLVERIIEQGWDVGPAARAAGLSTRQAYQPGVPMVRALPIGRQSSAQQPQFGTTALPAPDPRGAGRRGARLPGCRTRRRRRNLDAVAHEFVKCHRCGVRHVDRQLLGAGRQPRQVIAALAHEPPHTAAF